MFFNLHLALFQSSFGLKSFLHEEISNVSMCLKLAKGLFRQNGKNRIVKK